jgi:hypothetical protein
LVEVLRLGKGQHEPRKYQEKRTTMNQRVAASMIMRLFIAEKPPYKWPASYALPDNMPPLNVSISCVLPNLWSVQLKETCLEEPTYPADGGGAIIRKIVAYIEVSENTMTIRVSRQA